MLDTDLEAGLRLTVSQWETLTLCVAGPCGIGQGHDPIKRVVHWETAHELTKLGLVAVESDARGFAVAHVTTAGKRCVQALMPAPGAAS